MLLREVLDAETWLQASGLKLQVRSYTGEIFVMEYFERSLQQASAKKNNE
jgi:hypothetical protein